MTNPDVLQAAALVASRHKINVAAALDRLQRAARRAGMRPEKMACQTLAGIDREASTAV